uniref:Copia protein n=2 Tax=Culex pipiens TaxID=7175 RepID=A0A8D8G2M5_CULPI
MPLDADHARIVRRHHDSNGGRDGKAHDGSRPVKYLDVEAKRKSMLQEADSEGAAFAGRTRAKLRCYSCGEVGHKKVHCPKNKDHHKSASRFQPKKSAPKANVSKAVTFVATEGNDDAIAASTVTSSKWYLDSGASEHMCNDRSLFDSLEKLDKPVTVQTAKSGVTLSVFHCGSVVAFAAVDGASVRINIEKVLFIPDLSVNLLSLRKMGESGLKVVFYNGTVIVENAGQTVAVGKQSGKLYCMDFDLKPQRSDRAMVTGQVEQQVGLWHLRYGHLGNDNLLKLAKKNLVSGMQIDDAGHERLLCEACISGKLTRLPFPARKQKHSGRPLEIVHSDVCGPIDPVAWDGNRYFVTFTDDYTHLSVVYLLRSKSEVLERLREYEAMATAHFGTKMSRLRCDNGGEYTGEQVRRFCKQRGIRLEFTVPYTPEQNGVSERLNRTVIEKVRAMMEAKSVPKFLWGEAVITTVYLLNRSPSVAVAGDVTPFEAWSSRKPDVSHLRVFGSECYIHVPKQLRKKLDVKSEKVLFVGYASNGYRVWNGEKVIVARDAIFNETGMRPCTVTNCKRSVTITESVSGETQLPQKPEENDTGSREEQPQQPAVPEGGEEENDSEYFTEGSDADDAAKEENSEQNKEESAPTDKSKSGRPIIPPSWHKDFDMDISSYALSAEEFIDNIPSDICELRKRSDWPSWEEAIEEELSALKKNKTWHLLSLWH